MSVVKDLNRKKHFNPDEVLELWKEHFKDHQDTSFPYDENAPFSLNETPRDSEILEEITPRESETLEEIIKGYYVRKAIKRMKKRNAPGYDKITTEVIKAMVDILHKIL